MSPRRPGASSSVAASDAAAVATMPVAGELSSATEPATTDKWFIALAQDDPVTADQVAAALDKLQDDGPNLGRPLADRIHNSRHHHMKELRPRTGGACEIRNEQDLTQSELANLIGVTQTNVSRLENGGLDTAALATVRAYVEALGGRLRMVADFGDRQLIIQ